MGAAVRLRADYTVAEISKTVARRAVAEIIMDQAGWYARQVSDSCIADCLRSVS
jgi:hypothetical protein